jgi:hypothetical protein
MSDKKQGETAPAGAKPADDGTNSDHATETGSPPPPGSGGPPVDDSGHGNGPVRQDSPSPGARRSFFNLEVVGTAIFAALALAAALLTLIPALTPDLEDSVPVQAVILLLLAALAIAAVVWMNRDNALMIGRGLRHLLSINRAAVACFIISGTATVVILIYVAVAALSSVSVNHGLYLLASIEFLLKLTAVSAIIVLITLRRAPVGTPALAQSDVAAIDETEERGRLEFGSLAFAFGLVVIAALVVPTDELMRFGAMFFGGDKELEDYLPQRPVVRVEEDVPAQITMAVVQNTAQLRSAVGRMELQQQQQFYNDLHAQIELVIYSVVADRVKRIGAWTLFEQICDNTEDAVIFFNSDNRLVSEHISFLASEGLIEFPYGDINSLEVTPYGNKVMSKEIGRTCAGSEQASDTSTSGIPTINAPGSLSVRISPEGELLRLSLPEGNYMASLTPIDRVDPVMQLLDAANILVQQDDDGGPGDFDAEIRFSVREGEDYFIRAYSFDNRLGEAVLRIGTVSWGEAIVEPDPVFDGVSGGIGDPVAGFIPEGAMDSGQSVLDRSTPLPLADTVLVPIEGGVFEFVAEQSGSHAFRITHSGSEFSIDLIASLFHRSDGAWELVAEDDDGGGGGLPFVVASLAEGEVYSLVLRHFLQVGAQPVTVEVNSYPAVRGEVSSVASPAIPEPAASETPAQETDPASIGAEAEATGPADAITGSHGQ